MEITPYIDKHPIWTYILYGHSVILIYTLFGHNQYMNTLPIWTYPHMDIHSVAQILYMYISLRWTYPFMNIIQIET